MSSNLSTPQAILIGSVVVAIGVAVGLRGRAPEAPVPPPAPVAVDRAVPMPQNPGPVPVGAAERAPPAITAAGSGAPPAVAVSSAARQNVAAEAARALEEARPAIVKQCWAPSVEKDPAPNTAKYVFHISFDGTGIESARTIHDVGDAASRRDVIACLRKLPIGLRGPATGILVTAEVPFTLP